MTNESDVIEFARLIGGHVEHVYPPIPIRTSDWCVSLADDPEATCLYGYGETAELAAQRFIGAMIDEQQIQANVFREAEKHAGYEPGCFGCGHKMSPDDGLYCAACKDDIRAQHYNGVGGIE